MDLALFDPARTVGLKQALEHGGLPLFQITRSRRRDPIAHRMEKYRVLADEAECQRFQPDQIWFAVTPQVYHSERFRSFLQTVPSEKSVCFAPGRTGRILPGKARAGSGGSSARRKPCVQ